MESTHLGGGYYQAADEGQDEFLVAAAAEDVIFYDNLISSLDDLQTVSGSGDHLSSFSHTCMPSQRDTALEALQHGFGGWTCYPTDETTTGYPPVNIENAALSPQLFTTDGYIRSLSQPDVQSDTGDEFYPRSRSHSEHFDVFSDVSACDLSTFAQRGRETYSEALGQWNGVDLTSEAKIYDPFGTSVLLEQQQQAHMASAPSPPVSHHDPSPEHQGTAPKQAKQQFCATRPEAVNPSKKYKPSYSEVAKNGPCETRLDSKQKMLHADIKHKCKKGSTCNSKSHQVQATSSHAAECFYSRKSSHLEPKTIKPNSRYGLDTFEKPLYHRRSADDHLSCSSDGNPCAHKDGASSCTGRYSGVEELDSAEHSKRSGNTEDIPVTNLEGVHDRLTQSEPSCDIKKPKHVYCPEKDVHISNQGTEIKSQRSCMPGTSFADTVKERTKSGGDSTKQPDRLKDIHSSCSEQQEPEHVFFDPKRIFNTKPRSNKSHAASINTKKGVPNNEHLNTIHRPKPHELDNILNNDKPNTKINSNINKSCYINNNLKEPVRTSTKKQVNANAQHDSVNTPEHSHVSNHSSSGHHTPCADSTHPRKTSDSFPNPKHRIHTKVKSTKSKWDQLLGELAILLYQWVIWMAEELGQVFWNVTKLIISIGLALLLTLGQSSLVTVSHIWTMFSAKVFLHRAKSQEDHSTKKPLFSHKGLKENIVLPSTGDEAMERLLANKGKDPYSILGVRSDATDEVIKKYYRRQAVLVHPDKNQMPGAEEAFKILGHAFDLIGEPEKRRQFDTQTLESQEEEEAFYQFADLLNKLHEKMQEAANLMRCENCGGKHRRIPTERSLYSARYCQKCDYNHSVREGDVWAESHMLGFRWNYYACMEGKVYDITEWASCQADRFKHIRANSHYIAYRIATQSNPAGGRHRQNRSNEADLEDFLNQLFHQGADPGKSSSASDDANFGQFAPSRPSASSKSANVPTSKKGRRRKKRH